MGAGVSMDQAGLQGFGGLDGIEWKRFEWFKQEWENMGGVQWFKQEWVEWEECAGPGEATPHTGEAGH